MVAMETTSPHNFHGVYLSLCAVCEYVSVCARLCMGLCEHGLSPGLCVPDIDVFQVGQFGLQTDTDRRTVDRLPQYL